MIYLDDGAALARLLGLPIPSGLTLIDLRGPGAVAALDGLVLSTRVDDILENYLFDDCLNDRYI